MNFLTLITFLLLSSAALSIKVNDPCNAAEWEYMGKPDDSSDCRTYFKCLNGKVVSEACACYDTDVSKCPRFNPTGKYCDWYGNVDCKGGAQTTTQPSETTKVQTVTTTKAQPTETKTTVQTVTTTSAQPSTNPPSTQKPGPIVVGSACTNDWQPMPGDVTCQSYYRCLNGKVSYIGSCYGTLVFNPYSQNCDHDYNYECNGGNPTSRTTTTTTTTTDAPLSPIPGALITKEEFDAAVTGCGYPKASNNQYMNLVRQAGPDGGIVTKQQLAMFLAQILWESDGLRAKAEYACAIDRCKGSYGLTGYGIPGKYYYGRGYIQLTWDYNYNTASKALYNDDRLIQDPDQVELDDSVAWATAFWYWKAVVSTVAGYSQYHFGSTTMAINGALECWGDSTKARKRYQFYKTILLAFHISATPIETGCYN